MSRIKLVLLIAAGFILPVALAFTAYLISSGFDASANVVSVPGQRIAPATVNSSEPADDRGKDTSKDSSNDSSNTGDDAPAVSPTASPTDDHGGGDSDNSGPGSDSSGHGGGDDSGSGSDHSGHGGGDD